MFTRGKRETSTRSCRGRVNQGAVWQWQGCSADFVQKAQQTGANSFRNTSRPAPVRNRSAWSPTGRTSPNARKTAIGPKKTTSAIVIYKIPNSSLGSTQTDSSLSPNHQVTRLSEVGHSMMGIYFSISPN